jgi:hypothetical protein
MTLQADKIKERWRSSPPSPEEYHFRTYNINAKRIVRVRGELQGRFIMAGVSSIPHSLHVQVIIVG